MTTSEVTTPAVQAGDAIVEKIKSLFADARADKHVTFESASKVETEIAVLCAQVSNFSPGSLDHANAVETHHYMLGFLALLGGNTVELVDAYYAKGAEACAILLALNEHDSLHAVFSAGNLSVDLIHEVARYQDGLDWMLKSRALLVKMAGKKKLPKQLLHYKWYTQDYNIAFASFKLGDRATAGQIVKRILRQSTPLDKATAEELKSIISVASLLAEIRSND